MPKNCSWRLSHFWTPLTCVMVLHLLVSTAHAQRVDCRKFVFAPMCRGVAAKRGFPPGGPSSYLFDNDRKLSVLEEALGLYPSSSPQHPDTARELVQVPWSTAEQDSKPESVYDWYLNNRKRTRDPELAYDY